MVESFASLRARYVGAAKAEGAGLGARMRRMAEHMLTRIEQAWQECDGDWDAQEKLIQLYIKLSAAVQKIPIEKKIEEVAQKPATVEEDKAIIARYIERLREKSSGSEDHATFDKS